MMRFENFGHVQYIFSGMKANEKLKRIKIRPQDKAACSSLSFHTVSINKMPLFNFSSFREKTTKDKHKLYEGRLLGQREVRRRMVPWHSSKECWKSLFSSLFSKPLWCK